jgi:CRP-like cAMP-binding protein
MLVPKFKNSILSAMPVDDILELAPDLHLLALKRNHLLHETGTEEEWAYFPEDAVSSSVVRMKSGMVVEVGIIGREGFVGFAGVLTVSAGRSFIQVPGVGYRVKASLIKQHFNRSESFRSCMLRGVQGYFAQVSQTAACNRVHPLSARLARWLLMCIDRRQRTELNITHDFLAMMLGVLRPSVSVALERFRKNGLIESARGKLKILDVDRLRGTACECYATVQANYMQLGLL